MPQKNDLNKETGLSPQQENAAFLLISGTTMKECAKAVDVDRRTIQRWLKKENFQAYINFLSLETRNEMKTKLFSLTIKATKSIEECLESKNANIKFSAAKFVIEKIQNEIIGSPDPRELIRKKSETQYESDVDYEFFNYLLKENNLD
jgi:hypothetical protein